MQTLNHTLRNNERAMAKFNPGSKVELLIKLTAVIIFSIYSLLPVSAQEIDKKTRYSVCLENYSSANGHGAFYTPVFSATIKRNTFGLGPMIQKRSMQAGGIKLSYQRNLTGAATSLKPHDYVVERDILQLNFISYVQYNLPLPLCYGAVVIENNSHNDLGTNWNKAKLSTLEAGSGFQLQLNITENLCVKASIAASVYYHTVYVKTMYHDKVAPGLFLGTGIAIRL